MVTKEVIKRALTNKVCENCKYYSHFSKNNRDNHPHIICNFKTKIATIKNRKVGRKQTIYVYTSKDKSCSKWTKEEDK